MVLFIFNGSKDLKLAPRTQTEQLGRWMNLGMNKKIQVWPDGHEERLGYGAV
jgi:hypothetical protein